jgi:hippurate hydrolase
VQGPDLVDPEHDLLTVAEDFSHLARHRPSAFMLIGVGKEDGSGDLHTPTFNFNDGALPIGIAYWLSIVNRELNGRLGSA